MHCKYITPLRGRTGWLYMEYETSKFSLSLFLGACILKEGEKPSQWFIIHFINTSWFFILKLVWQIKKIVTLFRSLCQFIIFRGCHMSLSLYRSDRNRVREETALLCLIIQPLSNRHTHTHTHTHTHRNIEVFVLNWKALPDLCHG